MDAFWNGLEGRNGEQHFRYQRLHKILGQGNFFLIMSEGVLNGSPATVYDLFRVSMGVIVEHWDVLENIPPRSEWMNGNGKF